MRKGETKLWLASRSPGLERNGRVCNQARPAFTKASARILRQGEGWWRRRESKNHQIDNNYSVLSAI